METNEKRLRIIKPLIIILLLLGIVLSYGLYLKFRHADSIRYDGHGYSISKEITDKDEITSLKKNCPYTHKRDNGYKIYAGESATRTGEIYVERNGKFYNVCLQGSL